MDALLGSRKREREEEEEPRAAPPAEQPSDEMDAALALSGMLSASAQQRAPRAGELTAFPETNQFFPFPGVMHDLAATRCSLGA